MGKKKKKQQNNTPLGREQYEQLRQGVKPRADTWSPNGDKNNHKKNRKQAKQELRDYM